jgi:hypothetical protein
MSRIRDILLLGLFLCLVAILVSYGVIVVVRSSSLNERHILFEVREIIPSGHRERGFWIDSEGSVFRYDNSHKARSDTFSWITFSPPRRGEPPYTTGELNRYFGNLGELEFVGTIDSDTLTEMARLIQPASLGQLVEDDPLTPYRGGTDDAGTTVFDAYLHDDSRTSNTPVRLYKMGIGHW